MANKLLVYVLWTLAECFMEDHRGLSQFKPQAITFQLIDSIKRIDRKWNRMWAESENMKSALSHSVSEQCRQICIGIGVSLPCLGTHSKALLLQSTPGVMWLVKVVKQQVEMTPLINITLTSSRQWQLCSWDGADLLTWRSHCRLNMERSCATE